MFSSGEVPEEVWGRVLQPCFVPALSCPLLFVFQARGLQGFSGAEERQFTQVNSVPLLSLTENTGAALCNFIVDSVTWAVCQSEEMKV